MKKRVLILSHWLEIGGAERSLIGLLKAFDYERYEVDLYLCRHSGELMRLVPSQVHLLPEDDKAAAIARPIADLCRHPFHFAGILFARVKAKLYLYLHQKKARAGAKENIAEIGYAHRFCVRHLKKVNPAVEYDAAISFLAPHYIALKKVRAKRKIAWIHTDYTAIITDTRSETPMWNGFDAIAGVSAACCDNFLKAFPKITKPVVCIENILQPDLVREEARAISPDTIRKDLALAENEVLLCTVGRFCPPKNMESIPAICRRLKEMGLQVTWMLIGFGEEEDKVRDAIGQNNMEDKVLLLGKKDNPYPYINACDLYVQPSRYEGKAVTVREAQILAKPVVITAFSTAPDQVKDGFDGLIVPLDEAQCAVALAELIRSEEKKKELSENCKKSSFGNEKEIEKVYDLICH